MRIQDHRVTGVYERPRLNASAGSSNSSTSHAGSGTFVMPFSNFGGKISCVRGISFFAIRIFGWIQTTLNMLGHMAGRRMERQVSGTLKRNCRGTERDKQTLGRKISCGVHCVCVCVRGGSCGFFGVLLLWDILDFRLPAFAEMLLHSRTHGTL